MIAAVTLGMEVETGLAMPFVLELTTDTRVIVPGVRGAIRRPGLSEGRADLAAMCDEVDARRAIAADSGSWAHILLAAARGPAPGRHARGERNCVRTCA